MCTVSRSLFLIRSLGFYTSITSNTYACLQSVLLRVAFFGGFPCWGPKKQGKPKANHRIWGFQSKTPAFGQEAAQEGAGGTPQPLDSWWSLSAQIQLGMDFPGMLNSVAQIEGEPCGARTKNGPKLRKPKIAILFNAHCFSEKIALASLSVVF